MDSEGLAALKAQLPKAPPPAVAELPGEHLAHLAGAIHTARRRQAQQLQAASDQALDHIPRLLRGPVKKIVG